MKTVIYVRFAPDLCLAPQLPIVLELHLELDLVPAVGAEIDLGNLYDYYSAEVLEGHPLSIAEYDTELYAHVERVVIDPFVKAGLRLEVHTRLDKHASFGVGEHVRGLVQDGKLAKADICDVLAELRQRRLDEED